MSRVDVLIAGGGMVGISLALCLRNKLGLGTKLLLVESFPLPEHDPDFRAAYSPSFDARSTALSYASRLIYEELDLWPDLREHCCPIRQIHVSDRGRFGSTLMSAADYGWPALGYVVENAWLGNVLVQALHRADITTISPERVTGAEFSGNGATVSLASGDSLHAELLVVADGAQSSLRESLGIEISRQDYGQHALIANIAHAQPHEGLAYERFTPDGPLAMLPLVGAIDEVAGGGENRSALVWSLAPEQAAQMQNAEQDIFLAELQKAFGYRLGRLLHAGERGSYPLSLVQAREQVRSHLVVMGNAAHSLHPVAGQGFNLALRSVAQLGVCLSAARYAGASLGELSVLQGYQRTQQGDQALTTQFSDRLPGLFMQRDPALGILRDAGLLALDLSPVLKREFVRQTAGVAASARYRDVQP